VFQRESLLAVDEDAQDHAVGGQVRSHREVVGKRARRHDERKPGAVATLRDKTLKARKQIHAGRGRCMHHTHRRQRCASHELKRAPGGGQVRFGVGSVDDSDRDLLLALSLYVNSTHLV
jgi:hypothetical protein